MSWMAHCKHVYAFYTVFIYLPPMKFPGKRPKHFHYAKWFEQKKRLGFESSGAQGGRVCPCSQHDDSDQNQKDGVKGEG